MSEERNTKIIEDTLGFYDQTLDWLETHHADFAAKAQLDLDADDRAAAVWKLGGQSLAHGRALISLLRDGYTGQTWSTMRAIHEVNRLLGAVADPHEEEIVTRWLADKEVAQRDARAAETREAERVAEEMVAAGFEPPSADVGELNKVLYRALSRAAHHQRSVVDESVDSGSRAMFYGPDPRIERRLDFTLFAGALFHEILLKVGDSISRLWGPPFYPDHLAPMLRCYEEMTATLEVIDAAKRLGL